MSLDLERAASASLASEKDSSAFEPHVGIVDALSHDDPRPSHIKYLSRTQSLTLTPKPTVVQAADRLPVQFRTLSVHVTLTRDGDSDGGTAKQGKKSVKELAELDWQAISVTEAANRLGVDPNRGLDKEVAARRLTSDGPNMVIPQRTNWPKKIASYVLGGFNALLFGAAILVFVAWKPLGDPPAVANLALGIVLVVVAVASAGFNAWQAISTSRVMSSISSMLPSQVEIIRDGASMKVASRDLVVGDIIKIGLGDKVPCDCRLISVSSDTQFDRSILTGESEPIEASADPSTESFLEACNIALQGSLCIAGAAVAVVILTGEKTVFGRIARLTSSQTQGRTTLEKEVFRFVLLIASLAASVCLVIVIVWAAWLRRSYPDFINVPNLLITLVSVAVAFIPEGLPVCVTLSLSIIAQRMKKANVLPKNLATVETLGAVDVILSDKTGTLTTNRMSVVELYCGLQRLRVSDLVDTSLSEKGTAVILTPVQTALADCCALNNDSEYDSGLLAGGERNINGDATDSGLLRFSDRLSSSDGARARWNPICNLAFNSKNKFAIKLLEAESVSSPIMSSDLPAAESKTLLLLVKGAPDVLLKRCSSILSSDGHATPLSKDVLQEVTVQQSQMASNGQRVLLLARRILRASDFTDARASKHTLSEAVIAANDDLQIVGLVGLLDPPRHDTAETVRICRGAGIRFFMVTGDFALTACAIAKECGIFTQDRIDTVANLNKEMPIDPIPTYHRKADGEQLKTLVLSGSDLWASFFSEAQESYGGRMTMTDSSWKQTVAYDEVVFARTTPEQKLKIVKAFQNAGHICCATGDGTNDAAALKQSDIGLAFAEGSSVAIEAADLILLGDISAITEGVRLGRLVFQNLRRTIAYLLPAGSFSELWPVLLNVFFGLPQALSSIQMVIICCCTDLLPGLSMVREQPESDLMKRNPRRVGKDRLADWKLLFHAYAFLGMLEMVLSMISAFHFGFVKNGVPFSALWLSYDRTTIDPNLLEEATYKAQSIYFYNLVFMQIGNLLATRTCRLSILQQDPFFKKSTRNLFILIAVPVAIAFATFFSYVPAIQRVFDTRGVKWEYWLLPFAYALALLVLDETRKLWVRTWPKGVLAKLAWA